MNLSKKKWVFILVSCLSICYSEAQILAPDFSCISNDTLFWTPAQNTCGPFQAFRIYTADNAAGPYSQLVDIADPAQNSYYHTNPSDETRFYYIETVADCLGEVTEQSDTLDNLSPEQFSIASISVQTDTLRLSWEPSSSPEVEGYIIYRQTNLGTIPIDTVFQTTSYIDLQANPDQQSELYYVIALDPCGNTSIFDLPHNSIFLQTRVEDCDPNIYLSWNRYKNWVKGIEKQEVWVRRGTQNPVLVDELGPLDSTFIFTNTVDGETYRFFIRAIAQQSGYIAQSNTAERLLSIVQPINELIITHITVNLDQTLSIEWVWNKEADLIEFFLQENNGVESVEVMIGLNFPLSSENQWTTPSASTLNDSTTFSLKTRDECDRVEVSYRVRPIILSGEARRDFTNALDWTPYQIPNVEVLNYKISRISSGQKVLVNIVTADQTNYIDILDNRNEAEQTICYIIDAEVKIQLPDGREVIKTTQSNQICLQQFFTLLLPNAFAPDGRNNVFKPAIVFGENIQFEMFIYNRWGEPIFETTDISQGWNGRKNGVAMPAGVYIYLIRVKQPDGLEEEYKGFVTLVK